MVLGLFCLPYILSSNRMGGYLPSPQEPRASCTRRRWRGGPCSWSLTSSATPPCCHPYSEDRSGQTETKGGQNQSTTRVYHGMNDRNKTKHSRNEPYLGFQGKIANKNKIVHVPNKKSWHLSMIFIICPLHKNKRTSSFLILLAQFSMRPFRLSALGLFMKRWDSSALDCWSAFFSSAAFVEAFTAAICYTPANEGIMKEGRT